MILCNNFGNTFKEYNCLVIFHTLNWITILSKHLNCFAIGVLCMVWRTHRLHEYDQVLLLGQVETVVATPAQHEGGTLPVYGQGQRPFPRNHVPGHSYGGRRWLHHCEPRLCHRCVSLQCLCTSKMQVNFILRLTI